MLGVEVALRDVASQLEHGHAVAVVQSEVKGPHYLQELQHRRCRISIRLAMSLSSFEAQLKAYLFFTALPSYLHLCLHTLRNLNSMSRAQNEGLTIIFSLVETKFIHTS